MTLGEQHILKDAIEMAGLEDRSLLMPCGHKGRNASQNSEWNETEKSESASENDANRSSPVPETSESRKSDRENRPITTVMRDRAKATVYLRRVLTMKFWEVSQIFQTYEN